MKGAGVAKGTSQGSEARETATVGGWCLWSLRQPTGTSKESGHKIVSRIPGRASSEQLLLNAEPGPQGLTGRGALASLSSCLTLLVHPISPTYLDDSQQRSRVSPPGDKTGLGKVGVDQE
jgi:hypothetical protein